MATFRPHGSSTPVQPLPKRYERDEKRVLRMEARPQWAGPPRFHVRACARLADDL